MPEELPEKSSVTTADMLWLEEIKGERAID